MALPRALRSLTGCAVLLAALATSQPPRANAAAGFDSAYFGESAFLTLQPGQSDQFAVGFTNTGPTGWVRATATQVNLAQCCPLNAPSANSAWGVGWLSTTAYATATTNFVGPRQVGWFVYSIRAPTTASAGDYRFDGDLVLAVTGEAIHRDGYFQVATVAVVPTGPPPTGPLPSAVTSVACLNLREIRVTFSQAMAKSGTGAVDDPEHYVLSGGLDVDGGRVAADGRSVVLTVGRSVNGGHEGTSLSPDPATYLAQGTAYTLTVQNVATAALGHTAASTTTFGCSDTNAPRASLIGVPGAGTIVLAFNKPMDPRSFDGAVSLDSIPFGSLGKLRWQDRSGNVCAASPNGCFTRLRMDFAKGSIPSQGDHNLEIRNAFDASAFRLPPTSLTVAMIGPTTAAAPPVTAVAMKVVGGAVRVDVTFGESMAHSANGFAASESIDTAANYVLRNPDGSLATMGGSSLAGGTPITIDRVLPELTPTNASTPVDERAVVGDDLAFALQRVRLTFAPSGAPPLAPNVDYTLEIRGVRDQGGMPVTPGTVVTVRFAGDATAPRALRAFATSSQLRVDFSESMLANPSAQAATNAADPARYSSMDTVLQAALFGMTFVRLSSDGTGVVFNLTTPLASGTYFLDVGGVLDPFANLMAPNPTRLPVAPLDTQRPTLVAVSKLSGTELRITFSEPMKSGSTDPGSAGNPSNYSIDGALYGSLCILGQPTLTAEAPASNGQQSFHLVCSVSGAWSTPGSHSLTTKDAQDLAGNVINPNPAGPLSFQ